MDGITLAVTTAALSGFFAFIAWIAPRLTRQGRLVLEVKKLSDLRAGLPESDARDRFDEHIGARLSTLNEWLDPTNRRSRQLQLWASWVPALVGAVAVVTIQQAVEDQVMQFALTTVAFILVIGVGAGAMYLIEQWAKRSASTHTQRKERDTSRRRAAKTLGVSP